MRRNSITDITFHMLHLRVICAEKVTEFQIFKNTQETGWDLFDRDIALTIDIKSVSVVKSNNCFKDLVIRFNT